MLDLDDKELFRLAIETWGINAQLWMLAEEMGELLQEISKFKRGKKNLNSLAEEIGDVEIMLSQIKQCFNIIHLVEGFKAVKKGKLRRRLCQKEE